MQSKILKSSEKSSQYLSEAKELRSGLRYTDAVVQVNKSLCYATSNDQLAEAFAYRASVFHEVRKFSQCCNDLKLARSHGYAGELLRIEEQVSREKCHDESPWDFFKLSQPLNKKIPFISDCLKLHESWKYGRYIKTDRALKTGEVVAIEEPLFKMPNKDVRYKRCSNCLKSNHMSLLPCSQGCVSSM
jgi:hypothetical protein